MTSKESGSIDSQHLLIEGSSDDVRKKTIDSLEIMMPGGGFIADTSHDYILEETPVINVLTMFKTVKEFGRYET